VRASLQAVRSQYPSRELSAVLELHTFSSLTAGFLTQYAHVLDPADRAMVFYSSHALQVKRLPPLSQEIIRRSFLREDLEVTDDRAVLHRFIERQPAENANLLMMSSGSFQETPPAEILRLWQKV
jgi:UDP-N-acetylmuramate: L-alanyl-gamma-D-glutamyl-meso-diaminopimelate ligase